MKTVEVFTTNVQYASQANLLMGVLLKIFPEYSINFDLEDCDRILRVESDSINSEEIIRLLAAENFQCEILH